MACHPDSIETPSQAGVAYNRLLGTLSTLAQGQNQLHPEYAFHLLQWQTISWLNVPLVNTAKKANYTLDKHSNLLKIPFSSWIRIPLVTVQTKANYILNKHSNLLHCSAVHWQTKANYILNKHSNLLQLHTTSWIRILLVTLVTTKVNHTLIKHSILLKRQTKITYILN